MKPRLIKITTANPKNRWHQQEILESVKNNPKISERAGLFYKRFLSDSGIETRYFGLNHLQYVNDESPDEANRRFAETATELGSRAARSCLESAGVLPQDLNGLIVTTCTGYLCPGLTSYIAEALGLNEDLFSLDLAGLGCGAALPALRSAEQYLKAHPDSKVLVVCVEVCSAALSWGNETDLILSNCIFSDGAAACLLSNEAGAQGLEILGYESLLWPEHRDDLRFKNKNSRLCNVINRSVPDLSAEAVKQLQDKLLRSIQKPFHYYGVHPGGRRVLDEIETTLKLEPSRLKRSREVLRHYGNMSSPSILFVLKRILEKDDLQPGETIALFSFGAGFSAYGVVLQK